MDDHVLPQVVLKVEARLALDRSSSEVLSCNSTILLALINKVCCLKVKNSLSSESSSSRQEELDSNYEIINHFQGNYKDPNNSSTEYLPISK
ncbi:6217_t:CDS:2 [Entrophospora sp. SA101]|nr:6217_t:CDS:2 [Entrophospora sp. SA101]